MEQQEATIQAKNKNLQKSRLWTKQFMTLTVASFLLFLNLQMLLSSFSLHIKNNLNGLDMQVSLATSAFAITAIIARLITGSWIKRYSKSSVLTIGIVVACASTILCALPETVVPLLFMRAIYGFGFGIGSTIIPTLVSQIIPAKRMGEGIGYFGLSTSLAMSIGPAIGMSIMKSSGFTTLAIIAAGAVLCMFPMLFVAGVYKSKDRTDESKTEQSSSAKSNGLKVLTKFSVYFPAILNVLVSITYSGILSFIAVYGDELHLAQVGLFFFFNALTVILVRPISGKIFDRHGPIIVLMAGALFIIASMLVLSYTKSMGVLVVSALLYGMGFGSIQPTLQAWMLRKANKEDYGTINGMFYNATDVGISLGAILLGFIATLTSYDMMYRLSSICMVIFLASVIWHGIKNKK